MSSVFLNYDFRILIKAVDKYNVALLSMTHFEYFISFLHLFLDVLTSILQHLLLLYMNTYIEYSRKPERLHSS